MAILDIWHTNKYEQELRKSGMEEISRSDLRFSMGPVGVVSGTQGMRRSVLGRARADERMTEGFSEKRGILAERDVDKLFHKRSTHKPTLTLSIRRGH